MTTVAIPVMARAARTAARVLGTASGAARTAALEAMVPALDAVRAEVTAANAADLADAEADGLAGPLLKRLAIDEKTFSSLRTRLIETAALPDPVGVVLAGQVRPTGLRVERISVPLGVIGIIYESRPNVTTDASAVCLKSGNAVILRGGSEALRTNAVLAEAMRGALERTGLPADAVQLVASADRALVGELLRQDRDIDVIIPRGGRSLIERVTAESRIPVIKHYDGVCHLYLAADAPVAMAVDLVLNSKLQKVEVCNALETLLIDAAGADRLVPALGKALAERGVTIRGCERICAALSTAEVATEEDWAAEYLAPILAVRIIDGLDAAIDHIHTYGSGHTDGIVTADLATARAFTTRVDSASVLVNASTRLSGGGDYGLGAVVGISTDRLHARGPVGPRELCTYKWVAWGDGHVRG